jgi:uncharacterized protein (TIGR00661 family)
MRKKRILYAIQGTGNGHVARAREIIPLLQKYGDLHLLLSGDQSEVDLGYEIKYRLKGLTFIYNQSGAISYIKTLVKNNPITLIKDIIDLPVNDYDIIINDFEFTSAWASRLRGVDCIAFGHQASFLSARVPRPPKKELLGELILKWYAPGKYAIGLHFDRFDDFVELPVIRSEIRSLKPRDLGHYTVYLPAYGESEILEFLKEFRTIKWEIFSKFTAEKKEIENIVFRPINNDEFIHSLENCTGLLTSAGFEGPTEALFLGKKLCVIPIKNQYEQSCNAAGLKALGVTVLSSLKDRGALKNWLMNGSNIQIKYPDQTEEIIRSKILRLD